MNAETQQLAIPQEFNEGMLGSVNLPTSIVNGQANRPLVIADGAPRVPVVIPTGVNRTATVQVVDKGVNFCPSKDMLRAKWKDVAVVPNGKTLVWDGEGRLIARFQNWEMAAEVFERADILKAVKAQLEEIKRKREREEKAVRERMATMVVNTQTSEGGLAELNKLLTQIVSGKGARPGTKAEAA